MDKGAHFYKCDFQVHSPRDIQWTGNDFGVNHGEADNLDEQQRDSILSDRKQFAKEYLDKVRISGVNAIAITDHHDVTFAKIIRKVAEEENQEFRDKGEPQNCITVFPGIELTLDSPVCQCLLIFDSNFPDSHLDSALSTLGIVTSNENEKKTAPTIRISSEHISDLSHLYRKLDNVAYCKDRYIVLPNVNDGGTSTLLRNGAQAHYKKMPCVGGYVDKALSTNSGWLNKLNGGDVNYGNKPIGVISTSDNRYEDGREFGKFYTWIKWSEPSAEAIRQACLAKQSRITQETPQVPAIFITKIDVTNSRFLGSFSIEFNQQYNTLIGGRGTGKSTILEYLRWVLCDQTIISLDTDELTEIEKRRKNLIDKTLSPFEGEVRVTFVLNGINHIVKRSSVSNEISLKIDEGDFQRVSEDEIRRILPIQAYSQKQLSSVGVTTAELKRFIEAPILNEIGNLNFELGENVKKTNSCYLKLLRRKSIQKEIDQLQLEKTSIENQARSLRQSLTGISEADQVIISRKAVIDSEANFVSGVQRELNTIRSKVNEFESAIQNFPEPFPNITFENEELLKGLHTASSAKTTHIKSLIDQIKESLIPENNVDVRNKIIEWENKKAQFDRQYEEAKSKTTSNQQQLTEIQKIEDRLTTLQQSINERTDILRDLGDPQMEFDELRENYWEIHGRKAERLHKQAKEFESLSNGQIKVDVLKNIDQERIKSELTRVLQGARIQYDKIYAIAANVAQSENPLSFWNAILLELKQLAEYDPSSDSVQALPETPILKDLTYNSNNLTKIGEILNADNWLALATMFLEFSPDIKYSTNNQMGDVMPFADASAGQQATALLTVLLNQPGTPLIIDQPEDDIDNRAIDEIIKNIWEAKKRRQLIFTSHNANLVVNGDAELVICCDYRETGSQTRGMIKAEGAIDSIQIKAEITSVMEGGDKAFKLRKDKYGF